MSPTSQQLDQHKDAVTHMLKLSPTERSRRHNCSRNYLRVSFIKKNHVTFNQFFIPTITVRSTRINQSQQVQYIPNVILVKVKSAISTYIPNNNNKLIFIIIKSIQLTRHRTRYRYPKLFMILSDRKDLQ